MKIACTGSEGNLGKELVKRGCIPLNCDITDPYSVAGEIFVKTPDVVIHCAALTDVDYCEEHFKESFEVNVRGTGNVVSAMPKGSLFIYISSDHVFSGENWFNQGYGEYQKPSPVNRYGFSKWGGELIAKTGVCESKIVRSSKCFNYAWIKPTVEQLKNGEEVVFTDLIKRSFVHSQHFVAGLMYLAENWKSIDDDIIHISGDGVFSYYSFWFAIWKSLGLPGKILPRREKLLNETPRPFRGGLDVRLAKKIGIPIFNIADGIKLLKEGI